MLFGASIGLMHWCCGDAAATHRREIAQGTLGISGMDVKLDDTSQRTSRADQNGGVLLLEVALGGRRRAQAFSVAM
jgi:hypothetical protein